MTSAAVLVLAALAAPGQANVLVKGVVRTPPRLNVQRAFHAPGFWQLPNSVLDVLPPLVDPRRWMVVALEGRGLPSRLAERPTMTIQDSRVLPPVIAVRPGTQVSIENRDRQLHLLEPAEGKFGFPSRSIGYSDVVSHTFAAAGTYRLRCTEVPHVQATVLVTNEPQLTSPDGTGSFRFTEIPAGSYTLKVWHNGRWIYAQQITVRNRPLSVDVDLPPAAFEGR